MDLEKMRMQKLLESLDQDRSFGPDCLA